MGASVTRNSFSGWTYQEYIYTLFVALMDANRDISSIEVEVMVDHNFDDIVLNLKDGTQYYLQVKNYKESKVDDVIVDNDKVVLKSVKIKKPKNNQKHIIVLNTSYDKTCSNEIFGLTSKIVADTIIIPLTTDVIEDLLFEMINSEKRLSKICAFAKARIINRNYSLSINELPPLETFSTKLDDELICINDELEIKDNELLWCVGKPGVGKSYLAAELEKKYPNMVLYRFWTSSQDSNKTRRLWFDEFVKDIGIKFFSSAKQYTVEEIIAQIHTENRLFVIDGLDHVQNYAQDEFDKYIDFIEKITDTKTIILTRPLKGEFYDKCISLENWNKEQSNQFLSQDKYNFDYNIINDIYNIADGYPIITKFLAEHYLKEKSLNVKEKINSIDEYYECLIKTVDTKSALSVFLTTTQYITFDEIEFFLEKIYARIINEFIQSHPYLFEIKSNRITLIHDSFNTYLKNLKLIDQDLGTKVQQTVKNSLLSKEIQYMSRVLSFELSDEDRKDIYAFYANFEVFQEILNSNFDFESVKEFYISIKTDLKNYANIYDIYKYYSFILICEIVERNDFVGIDALIKNHVQWLVRHGVTSKEIYSSGAIWYAFLSYETNEIEEFKPWINRHDYSNDTIDEIDFAYALEDNFFNCINIQYDYDEIYRNIKNDIKNDSYERFQVQLMNITSFLTNIYKFGCKNKELENHVRKYIDNDEVISEFYIEKFFYDLQIDDYLLKHILRSFKERIMQLGLIEKENIYLSKNIESIISQKANEGFWITSENVNACIRLNLFLNREIDIAKIWKVYFMYYNRKDYTVLSLPEALVAFEKVNFIREEKSIKILAFVMGQSEKGIRHLLNDYTDLKEDDFICRSQNNLDYIECSNLNLLHISPLKINILNDEIFYNFFAELIYRNRRSKSVEYDNIINSLLSKHKLYVANILNEYNYKVINVPKDKENFFTEISIEFWPSSQEKNLNGIPLSNGYIHEKDFDYIKIHNYSILEIARLPGGWYSCLPYLEIFDHFDDNIVKDNLLKIIHESMYANIHVNNYLGYWHNYLGYIPKLIHKTNYPIDWKRCYDIFTKFLKYSSIYLID